MGGGLMQLVAMGAQDVYLTGNPQITFFKVVYRRHTNFSKECIKQEFNGGAAGTGGTCTLARNGDLVQEIYVQATSDGTASVTTAEVEIGGQKIDKHYSQWLAIYDDLFDENAGLKKVLGNVNGGFVPLRFWFNRNPGLALPLIALQYHEVKVIVTGSNCSHLLVNYLYLDTDERRRFAQVSHEYLIEQVQHTGVESLGSTNNNDDGVNISKSLTLTFNHPVKALFWRWGTGTGTDNLGGYNAKLQLNGHDRASAQPALYFTGVQPYECGLKHNFSDDLENHSNGMYSFCLKPGEHQPSGTCNFSRIDNARLVLEDIKPGTGDGQAQELYVFALNYNVLRIMSGMGGLAYSN